LVLVQQAADILYVLRAAGEAGGDEVVAVLDTEQYVLLVLLAQVGHGQGNTGHVNALVVADGSDVVHQALDVGVGHSGNGHADQAVGQQHGAANGSVAGQILIGDGADVLVALHVTGGQGELLAGFQLGLAAGELLQTDLGALGVQQSSHGAAQLLTQSLQLVQTALVLLVVAVGK